MIFTAKLRYNDSGGIIKAYANGQEVPLNASSGPVAWGDVTGKPSVFPPETHNHSKAEIEAVLTGVISSHSHAGSTPTVVTLAGDQATGANVTPVTLTGLVFNFAANSTYRIWGMGRVQPVAATTGCGFQFDVSAAVTSINLMFFHQLANAGTLSGGHSIADDVSVGVSSGLPGTSTYPVTLMGMIVTGANAGTAQLRFRSETTAVITCKAGFTLVVEKIA